MISKQDFYKVWSQSTTESILNQFYYEHVDLRQLLQENEQLLFLLERASKLIPPYYDGILYEIKNILDKNQA